MLPEVWMARVLDVISSHRAGHLSCVEAGELLGFSERVINPMDFRVMNLSEYIKYAAIIRPTGSHLANFGLNSGRHISSCRICGLIFRQRYPAQRRSR